MPESSIPSQSSHESINSAGTSFGVPGRYWLEYIDNKPLVALDEVVFFFHADSELVSTFAAPGWPAKLGYWRAFIANNSIEPVELTELQRSIAAGDIDSQQYGDRIYLTPSAAWTWLIMMQLT